MGSVDNAPRVGVAAHWSDLPRAAVFSELDKILDSHQFRASKKCSRFLRHVVEAAVDGRFDCLKERTLGVDVFDREPHYDTNQDPIVRGTAGEVRKRLAQYYLEAPPAELRFGLPPGSYVPEAHLLVTETHKAEEPVPEPPVIMPPVTVEPAARPSRRRAFPAVLLLAGLAVIAGSWWIFFRPSPLDSFWAPVLEDHSVLVCLGQPQFYSFRPETAAVLNPWFATDPDDQRAEPALSPVPVKEIVPMWSEAVALADARAFSRVANLLAQKGKRADLRGDRLISLTDLRDRPAVLIGAFDNQWTLSFTGELRYHFEIDRSGRIYTIRDRQNPAGSGWHLVDPWPPGRTINEDYALVTRVVNRTTERTVLILGGIAQYGTEAAAEFVTQPAYFQRALAHAPSDWRKKNMQVVLSTRVISGVAGPPTVIAVYFW